MTLVSFFSLTSHFRLTVSLFSLKLHLSYIRLWITALCSVSRQSNLDLGLIVSDIVRRSLMYALEDNLKHDLLKLATQCVSPKQKALVKV
ncbi:hypothetical protein KC19_VG237100 [Ceratodon purpureus]|uniref:Uncharacterized protein n=1 Tax=Ceratodon purpureus TaxID=3225 RepID=A0A8T0HTG4_CERPU|nr:hypothetical protein KC19_VG237100 [Ceratodon purpureus]